MRDYGRGFNRKQSHALAADGKIVADSDGLGRRHCYRKHEYHNADDAGNLMRGRILSSQEAGCVAEDVVGEVFNQQGNGNRKTDSGYVLDD